MLLLELEVLIYQILPIYDMYVILKSKVPTATNVLITFSL